MQTLHCMAKPTGAAACHGTTTRMWLRSGQISSMAWSACKSSCRNGHWYPSHEAQPSSSLQLLFCLLGLEAVGAGDRLDGAERRQPASCIHRCVNLVQQHCALWCYCLHSLIVHQSCAGQEYVWQRVFAAFNVTETELEGFFAGPAFLAWGRMGNVQGYGGQLPQRWIESQAGRI